MIGFLIRQSRMLCSGSAAWCQTCKAGNLCARDLASALLEMHANANNNH